MSPTKQTHLGISSAFAVNDFIKSTMMWKRDKRMEIMASIVDVGDLDMSDGERVGGGGGEGRGLGGGKPGTILFTYLRVRSGSRSFTFVRTSKVRISNYQPHPIIFTNFTAISLWVLMLIYRGDARHLLGLQRGHRRSLRRPCQYSQSHPVCSSCFKNSARSASFKTDRKNLTRIFGRELPPNSLCSVPLSLSYVTSSGMSFPYMYSAVFIGGHRLRKSPVYWPTEMRHRFRFISRFFST